MTLSSLLFSRSACPVFHCFLGKEIGAEVGLCLKGFLCCNDKGKHIWHIQREGHGRYLDFCLHFPFSYLGTLLLLELDCSYPHAQRLMVNWKVVQSSTHRWCLKL